MWSHLNKGPTVRLYVDLNCADGWGPNLHVVQRSTILTDLKGETDNNTIIVGDFSVPL